MEHWGGRGAISVARTAKSAFTNISIWNIVCHSLGQKKKKNTRKCLHAYDNQRGLPELTCLLSGTYLHFLNGIDSAYSHYATALFCGSRQDFSGKM